MQGLFAKVSPTAPRTFNQVNVMREGVLECALRVFWCPSFDPRAHLDIVIVDVDGVGEGAADDGGPSRQFFRLFMKEIMSSQVFEGPEIGRTLALNALGELLHKCQCFIHGTQLHSVSLQVSPKIWCDPRWPIELLWAQCCSPQNLWSLQNPSLPHPKQNSATIADYNQITQKYCNALVAGLPACATKPL